MNDPININETIKMHRDGTLLSQPKDILERCSRGLLGDLIDKRKGDGYTIPALEGLIHQALLMRLLEEQERRNKKSTIIIIILAVATLLSTITQIGIALYESEIIPTKKATESAQVDPLDSPNIETKIGANQRLDLTVKTPADSVDVNRTAGQP